MSGAPENLKHLFKQVEAGEFGIYGSEAQALGMHEFARKYGHKIWGWGRPEPIYHCVRHEGTDYLWRISDGTYDGWDGANLPPRESRDDGGCGCGKCEVQP